MRNYFLFHLLLFVASGPLLGQSLTFGIANKVTTSTDVTFDVTLSSDTPFKLGSGQLYFNFNTDAFGEWAHTNSMVTISRPSGCLLAEQYFGLFDIYSTFITNDNTASRFSFSWQQAFSSGAITADNITSTAVILFQVTIAFDTGGAGEPDDICFESGSAFDDQTFTACGSTTPAAADCFNNPGSQLTDDNFDCSFVLPIELVDFRARAQDDFTSLIEWQTTNEINNDYFTIEHSVDGRNFLPIAEILGAGNSQQLLHYETLDPNPSMGINYYRLKQTDFDGQYDYSEVRSVTFEEERVTTFEVFPNPTSEVLNIRFNRAIEQGQVQLFSTSGQLLNSYALERGSQSTQLRLDHLAKGLYWIKIDADGQFYSQNIILAK